MGVNNRERNTGRLDGGEVLKGENERVNKGE